MKVRQLFALFMTAFSYFSASMYADDDQYNPRTRRYQTQSAPPGGQVQGQPGGQVQGQPGQAGSSLPSQAEEPLRKQRNQPDVYRDEQSGARYVIPWNESNQYYGTPPPEVLDSPHKQKPADQQQQQQQQQQ